MQWSFSGHTVLLIIDITFMHDERKIYEKNTLSGVVISYTLFGIYNE